MSVGISLEELRGWNDEAARQWKAHFEANPQLLELPCGIGGTATVQELVRHIWGAELRWTERLAGLPETPREQIPAGPLEALFGIHEKAQEIFKGLLAGPAERWDETYTLTFDWVPTELRQASYRKLAAHFLIHSQRHWAQLATLARNGGYPAKFMGDLLFSRSLK